MSSTHLHTSQFHTYAYVTTHRPRCDTHAVARCISSGRTGCQLAPRAVWRTYAPAARCEGGRAYITRLLQPNTESQHRGRTSQRHEHDRGRQRTRAHHDRAGRPSRRLWAIRSGSASELHQRLQWQCRHPWFKSSTAVECQWQQLAVRTGKSHNAMTACSRNNGF